MTPTRRCAVAPQLGLVTLLTAALSWLAPRHAHADPQSPRILHVASETRTAEQGILTPVPIRVEIPIDLPARRVLLHYRIFGAPEWRTLELHRDGKRYVGAIPCLEVTFAGELRYYIRVHDQPGAVIAFSGTRANPYRVAIHHPSARPDLISQHGRCPDPADCPPGLPGCPSAEVEQIPCQRDRDCEGSLICGWEGFCVDAARPKNWLGVEVEQGLGFVATAGACSVSSQENDGYACYRADGSVYKGRPVYTNEPIRAGLAQTRVVLSYDRLIFYNSSIGGRVGYALLGSGPTPAGGVGFVPLSVELNARYWFGDDPFTRRGLRPFVSVASGFAQHDVPVEVHVREDPGALFSQSGNDLEQKLSAWKRAGDGFVALGGGAMYPLGQTFAAGAELSVCQTFPFPATLLRGSISLRAGFR
jgi:hypothetical protein